MLGTKYEPTWREEAVEVTDHAAKCWPERGFVVHAAGYQIGKFSPLWGRKLVAVVIEQPLLQQSTTKQIQ